jgi:ABC-type multidrug transport system ATPase subunit
MQMSHALNLTTIISLLQPPPEVFNMFDDLLLLANGKMLYHGPLQVRSSSRTYEIYSAASCCACSYNRHHWRHPQFVA